MQASNGEGTYQASGWRSGKDTRKLSKNKGTHHYMDGSWLLLANLKIDSIEAMMHHPELLSCTTERLENQTTLRNSTYVKQRGQLQVVLQIYLHLRFFFKIFDIILSSFFKFYE